MAEERPQPPVAEQNVQLADEEDLSFGGWRDWVLVLVGLPVVLSAMVVLARSFRAGSHPRPWPVAVGVVLVAIVAGLVRAKAR